MEPRKYLDRHLSEEQIRDHVDTVDWHDISYYGCSRSEQFIRDFKHKLIWEAVSSRFVFTKELATEFVHLIIWDEAITNKSIPTDLILLNYGRIKIPRRLFIARVLPAEFIIAHAKEIDWQTGIDYKKLNETTIRSCLTYIDWSIVHRTQLSVEFYLEYTDKLDWDAISMEVSPWHSVFNECSTKIDWLKFSTRRDLCEDAIIHHADRVDWLMVSGRQYLSEGLLRLCKGRIPDWTLVKECQHHLSRKFLHEMSCMHST